MPPTPPPTSGPSRTKRTRTDSDVDETPIKKGKGKGKSKGKARVEEVVESDEDELGVEQSGEQEEMEGRGEGEDQVEEGDEYVYDPEGEALGDVEEEEDAVLPVVLAEKKARRAARPRIYLEPTVSSFTAIRIGEVRQLPILPMDVRVECMAEYKRRMQYIISQRHALAHSEMEGLFPMSNRMRRWWTSQTDEEIWDVVRTTTSHLRKLILGGMWLGHYKFTDLPPMTNEELAMWFVYGDQVFENKADRPDESAAYVGSATRDPADGAGFNRVGDYERAKRRADAGIDVSIETDHSKHLRMGLRKGATMELRVLAVFDPMAFDAVVPLAVEGIYLDFLQSFDRDWVFQDSSTYFGVRATASLQRSGLDVIPSAL